MCKGSNTTSQTTSPNPTASAAYQALMGNAATVAATPYNPYTGELVAGMNPQQDLGISGVNANANFAQPYIQQAAGLAASGATPLTAADIQNYIDPYTQTVIDATQAQFKNQNDQAQQGVIGNAISQGALGGNRVGIAQAELANQQQLAQAPVIANLQNQGYQTALNTALTEKQAQAQGAYSLGNIGVSGQNAALTGANAQFGVGSAQQQTQQAYDQALYQQFINQNAYPFQTLQWLSGIDTGVGSQMGGTSTTTAPPPSTLGQLGGLGASTIGLLGGTGAFGAAGWLAPLMGLATGGRVSDSDGVANHEMTIPETPETLHAQQQQLVAGHRRVHMFPKGTRELPVPHGMARVHHDGDVFHYDPRKINAEQVKHQASRGRHNDLLDLGPVSKAEVIARVERGEHPLAVVERHPNGTEVRAAVGTHVTAPAQIAAMNKTKSPGHRLSVEDPRAVLAHRIHRAFGGAVPGYDAGGGVAGSPFAGSVLPFGTMPFAHANGFVPGGPNIARGRGLPQPPAVSSEQQSLQKQAKDIGDLARTISGQNNAPAPPLRITPSPVGVAPVGSTMPPVGLFSPTEETGSQGAVYRRGGVVGYADGGGADDDDVDIDGDGDGDGIAAPPAAAEAAPEDAYASARAPIGIAPTPGSANGVDWSGNSKLWPALTAAGFGMMASRSPFPGVAIGEGGLTGLQAYSAAKQSEAQGELKKKALDLQTKKLEQAADIAQKNLELHTRPYTEMTVAQKEKLAADRDYREKMLSRENSTYLGPSPDGKSSYFLDRKSGAVTEQPIAIGAKPVSGANLTMANALIADREEQRKADPSLPPLTLEEATAMAHRAPNQDANTIRRLNMAQGAWKSWTNNPLNMSKKDAPEASIDHWNKYYGVTSAPGGSKAGAPAASAIAPPGKGTADQPFVATTQAQIDWFKNSAPSGSVVTINGKQYTK